MLSQTTMDKLRSIGLNLYERKLYVALVAKGTASAGELSEMAGVPRSRAYDVLSSLADKGFVVVQHAKPLRYVAVPPKEALNKTKELLKTKLKTSIQRIDEFMSTESLTELTELYSQGINTVEPGDLSGSLKGRYSMYQQIGTMFKSAQSSIDILTTVEGSKSLWTNYSGLLQSARDNGVVIRVIAPVNDENKTIAESLSKIVEFKGVPLDVETLPYGRLFVIDGKEVVVGLTDDISVHETQDVSFWTASEHFAKKFVKPTFDMIWNNIE